MLVLMLRWRLETITRAGLSPNTSLTLLRNQVHDVSFSESPIPNANGKFCWLTLCKTSVNITSLYLPFRWVPSILTMGLQNENPLIEAAKAINKYCNLFSLVTSILTTLLKFVYVSMCKNHGRKLEDCFTVPNRRFS